MISPAYSRWLALLLVAFSFGFASLQVSRHYLRTHAPDRITLRFSHWQLEPGVREAFDVLAREYEARHPHVRIEQLLIPERIYRQWTSTQLVGGKAPDLVQLGKGVGGGTTGRYFHPITTEANLPNPYNAGTSLEHTPWRNTFIDGMEGGYDPETFECYSASMFTGTIRMYYNVDLLRTITGRDDPPATFDELRELCARVHDYARRQQRDLVPIAGSHLSGVVLLDALFAGQTQRLATELNPGGRFPLDPESFSLAYLTGRWTVDHPAMTQATVLLQHAATLMPPGFMQAGREQANLQFVQGRALMMMGFSIEAQGVHRQATFPVRAFRCPTPGPDDPRYGSQVIAQAAEGGVRTYGGFGLTRSSRHPAQALDFLHFLTSEASCRQYTRISRNLPVITTVEVPEELRDFVPQTAGFPPGPTFMYTTDVRHLLDHAQHLLIGPEGSPAAYLDQMRRRLGPAIRSDIERNLHFRLTSVRRLETSIAAAREMLHPDPLNPILQEKYQSQVEAQNELEAQLYYTRLRLSQATALTAR